MIKEILSKIYKKDVELQYRIRLYLSESLDKKDLSKIKSRISKGKGKYKLILISDKEDENFDIVSPGQLKLRIWEGKKPVVAGIADGEEEAYELVMKIIEDCIEKRRDFNLKEYILSL